MQLNKAGKTAEALAEFRKSFSSFQQLATADPQDVDGKLCASSAQLDMVANCCSPVIWKERKGSYNRACLWPNRWPDPRSLSFGSRPTNPAPAHSALTSLLHHLD